MEIFQLGYQQLLNRMLKRINKKWEIPIIGVSHFLLFIPVKLTFVLQEYIISVSLKLKGINMKSFNHYTLNSNHSRISYSKEVDPNLYFHWKKQVINGCKSQYTHLFDNVYYSIKKNNFSYELLLYVKDKELYVPVLASFGCSQMTDYKQSWDNAYAAYKVFYPDGNSPKIIPSPPFVVDVLLPMYVRYMKQLMGWTGDFTRCIGWMVLDPEAILE